MDALRSLLEWIVSLLGPFVAPDWGALIQLLPIIVLLVVAGFYAWIFLRFRRAGPRRIGMPPLPVTSAPAGIHLPGPSLAPLLISVASAALFFSVALGGVALAVSAGAMLLALVAWGREAVREYDAIGAGDHGALAISAQSGREASGPPAGVHLPPPSLLPFLVSLATGVLLFGAAIGLPFLLLGALMTAFALIGWLLDAGREYRAVTEADRTGHLVNPTPKSAPRISLILFSLLFVVVGGAQMGVFAAPAEEGGATPAPSGAPSESGAPTESGAPSAGPDDGITLITAMGVKFEQTLFELPADMTSQLRFHNMDVGIPHNIAIHEGSADAVGPELWQGEIFNGDETRLYDIPAFPAGSYSFVCTVHPNMVGDVVVQ